MLTYATFPETPANQTIIIPLFGYSIMPADKNVNLCRISVQLTIVTWLLPLIISAPGTFGVVAVHGFWYLVAPLFAILFAIAGLILEKPGGMTLTTPT